MRSITLEEAMEDFWHDMEFVGEAWCPICKTLHKIQEDKISETDAIILLIMSKLKKTGEWFKMSEELPYWCEKFRHYTWLRWDKMELMEQKSKGIYRLTTKGYEFARGLIKVPRTIYHFREVVLKQSKDGVDIRHALKYKGSVSTLNDLDIALLMTKPEKGTLKQWRQLIADSVSLFG